MNKKNKFKTTIVFAFCILIHYSISAKTTTWNGSTWSNGTPSWNNDDIIINGDFTVVSPADMGGSLTVNSPAILTVTGDLTIKNGCSVLVASGASLNVSGLLKNKNNNTSGVILSGSVSAGSLDNGNGATMQVPAGGTLSVSGNATNTGSLEISGTVNVSGTLTNTGTITDPNDTGTLNAGTINNSGTIAGSTDPNGAGSTLPVELTKFLGAIKDQNVILKWETASEKNNSHFDIERSIDGVVYGLFETIKGNGTINEVSKYEYIDHAPYFGVSYYRLVQTDYDGIQVKYDAIKINNKSLEDDIDVSFSPNPTLQDNINFNLTSGDENSIIHITIINLQGQIVHIQQMTPVLGSNDYHIKPAGHLDRGLYHVTIRQGVNQVIKKIIIN